MVGIDKAVIARYKKGEMMFEVLVDCDKAMEFKKGNGDLGDVLATDDIFIDVKQDKRASDDEMEKVFGTTDPRKVAEKIVKEGEVQLTAEYKAKILEQKKKQLINTIVRNAVNAQTGHPFPPDRVEMLLDEAKVRVNEYKPMEQQVQEALSALKPLVPIKFETRVLKVKIPSQYAGQSFNMLKKFGKVNNEQWLNDGSLQCSLELPAGMQEDFERELNSLTHGDNEIMIEERK